MSRIAALTAAIEAAQRNAAAYRSLSPQARRELAEANIRARRHNRPNDVRSPAEFVLEGQLAAIAQGQPWAEDEALLARVDHTRPQIQRWLDDGETALEHAKQIRRSIDGDYARRKEAAKLDREIVTLEADFARRQSMSDLELHAAWHAHVDAQAASGPERMRLAQMGAEGERRRVASLPESERHTPTETARAQAARTEK